MYYNRNRFTGITIRHDRQEAHEYKPFKMHTHSTAELFYFIAGRAVFHIEGNSYVMKPGDILLMRPAEAHYIEQDPALPYERICLNFETDMFRSLDPENQLLRPYYDREAGERNRYSPEGAEGAACYGYLKKILDALDRMDAMANLMLLLGQIDRLFEREETGIVQPETLEYRLVRYINRNLSSELSIAALCDRFYISRAQLCRRFKRITGTSVGKYVTAKRLMQAQELMRQGGKPTEVYESCGYQDYSTFYRAYLQYFGYSPKDNKRLEEPQKERLEIV